MYKHVYIFSYCYEKYKMERRQIYAAFPAKILQVNEGLNTFSHLILFFRI